MENTCLNEMLESFNSPIDEEKCWAICYKGIRYLQQTLCEKSSRRLCLEGVGDLEFTDDGEISRFIPTNLGSRGVRPPRDRRNKPCIESQLPEKLMHFYDRKDTVESQVVVAVGGAAGDVSNITSRVAEDAADVIERKQKAFELALEQSRQKKMKRLSRRRRRSKGTPHNPSGITEQVSTENVPTPTDPPGSPVEKPPEIDDKQVGNMEDKITPAYGEKHQKEKHHYKTSTSNQACKAVRYVSTKSQSPDQRKVSKLVSGLGEIIKHGAYYNGGHNEHSQISKVLSHLIAAMTEQKDLNCRDNTTAICDHISKLCCHNAATQSDVESYYTEVIKNLVLEYREKQTCNKEASIPGKDIYITTETSDSSSQVNSTYADIATFINGVLKNALIVVKCEDLADVSVVGPQKQSTNTGACIINDVRKTVFDNLNGNSVVSGNSDTVHHADIATYINGIVEKALIAAQNDGVVVHSTVNKNDIKKAVSNNVGEEMPPTTIGNEDSVTTEPKVTRGSGYAASAIRNIADYFDITKWKTTKYVMEKVWRSIKKPSEVNATKQESGLQVPADVKHTAVPGAMSDLVKGENSAKTVSQKIANSEMRRVLKCLANAGLHTAFISALTYCKINNIFSDEIYNYTYLFYAAYVLNLDLPGLACLAYTRTAMRHLLMN